MAEVKNIENNKEVKVDSVPAVEEKKAKKKVSPKKVGKAALKALGMIVLGVAGGAAAINTVGKPKYATLPMDNPAPQIDATEGIDFVDAAKANLENAEVKEF